MENEECLVHYGTLGMKWGIRRQERKAARNNKRAGKMQKKIDANKAEISEHVKKLKDENAKRLKSTSEVLTKKKEVRDLGQKIKNEDYGLVFRASRERKAKKRLAEATTEYKKALDLDLSIETNQAQIRAKIQNGREAVDYYTSKQVKYLDKAAKAEGKAATKKMDLDKKLKSMK